MSKPDPSPSLSDKRKRSTSRLRQSTTQPDTTRDEELAQQLQDDEYNVEDQDEDQEEEQDEAGESPEPRPKRRRTAMQAISQMAASVVRGALGLDDDASDSNEAELLTSDESAVFTNSDGSDDEEVDGAVGSNFFPRAVEGLDAMNDDENSDAEAGTAVSNWRSRLWQTKMDARKARRRKKLEKAHPEIIKMWDVLEEVPIIKPIPIAQPASINRKLKPFQLEGVDWMIKQEKSQYKGGLLGDEMGMGKTIQAVSLIMSDFPAKAPSLVLVPPVALMQWQNEINSYTNNTLKVLVVHNTNAKSKNLNMKTIKSYNVVLMSYNSLESMYRKQEKGWTRGENMVKEDSPIHSMHWHRIILDEAHSIKSRTTGSAKSCFALEGTYKWCLSGTPVQNRIGEFFSLLRFLGVRPFADYFCEACPCAELHWTIDANYRCKHCKHSASEHRSVFNEEILNPIIHQSKGREDALAKLHMITDRMMLRRLKKDYTSSMELPPKLVTIRNEFFSTVERDFAGSVMGNSNREFDTYVSRGVLLNNYANIFGLLMMMRQVANHPDLILKKNAEGSQNVLVCNICDEIAEDAVRSKCRHEFCRSCVKTYLNSHEDNSLAADCPRCHIVSRIISLLQTLTLIATRN
jgi:DNA repair protein RAD16